MSVVLASTEQLEFFISYLTVAVFAILSIFYMVQGYFAKQRATQPLTVNQSDGTQVSTNLFRATLHFDDGLRNLWVFFILAIFVPVFLASMVDIVSLVDKLSPTFSQKNEEFSASSSTDSIAGSSKSSQKDEKYSAPRPTVEYFICLAIIVVLITLEFSYVHNLRESATVWIPMLLVALALDFATLLTFTFLVKPPDIWEKNITGWAEAFMIITTVLALITSFMILVLARTAGALFDGKKIDVPPHEDEFNANQSGEQTQRI